MEEKGIGARDGLPPGHRRRSTNFRESKPKFLYPNFFSTMAEINPTTSLVLNVAVQSVLQIDLEVEEPETLTRP